MREQQELTESALTELEQERERETEKIHRLNRIIESHYQEVHSPPLAPAASSSAVAAAAMFAPTPGYRSSLLSSGGPRRRRDSGDMLSTPAAPPLPVRPLSPDQVRARP